MSRLIIFPWKETSEGAKLLSEMVGAERFAKPNERLPDHVVINWGNGYASLPQAPTVFNRYGIETCTSKIRTYKALNVKGVPTLDWTRDRATALGWHEAGCVVYGRDDDAGLDGHGITVYASGATPPKDHLFYTKRFKTKREFRVNCAFGQAIDVLEKKKRIGSKANPLIRCGDDWLYCRNELEEYPEEVRTASAMAVSAIGLDFGGCDVGVDSANNVCIFEVNSAPWLGRIIAQRYINAFNQKIRSMG